MGCRLDRVTAAQTRSKRLKQLPGFCLDFHWPYCTMNLSILDNRKQKYLFDLNIVFSQSPVFVVVKTRYSSL
jgi:hypothetical protein